MNFLNEEKIKQWRQEEDGGKEGRKNKQIEK
jgi:hypothetical protein